MQKKINTMIIIFIIMVFKRKNKNLILLEVTQLALSAWDAPRYSNLPYSMYCLRCHAGHPMPEYRSTALILIII